MSRHIIKVFLILLLIIFASSVSTEIYQWRDSNGKLHFGDSPPIDNKSKKLDEKILASRISSYTNVSVEIVPIDFGENPQVNWKVIVMYATLRCPYCAKARAYFSSHNIEYVEKNIDNNPKFKAEFKSFNGKGVPMILYGKYRMNGFSEKKFKKNYSKWRS